MHNLLKRQLKIYFGDSLQVPTEWQKFIEAVNDAYMQSDVDRDMLERSLDLSSQELLHTNSEMRALISLLSATIESTADGILVINKEGKIVSFNQKFVEMWHIPQQIIESRDDDQALSFVLDQLKDPEGFLRKVRELYANPEAESYDELLFKDGRVFERYSKPQRIGQAVAGRVWSFRDITERKRAEERLVRSEEYFRALIENSSDIIIIVDKKGTITYTSPSIERFLGYKPKELIGKSSFNFILPADLPRAIFDFGKAIITKEVRIPNVFRVRHKDGSERILEGVGRNLLDNPVVAGFVMNARDVSERKQAEAALRTSEAQLSNALRIAHMGHWEYDVASDLFTFNDHFYAIFRTTAEEVGGYTMSSSQYAERFVHPADISIVSTETQKAIETNDPLYSRQLEHRIIYADGETGYITVRFFIVKDDQGKTVKTYGANQDITERKQAAETLKESEGRLRAVTESAKDAIIMIDHKGDTSYWNPAAERIFGYGREEALGRSVHKLLAPEKYYEAYLKAFPEFARTGRGNAVGKTLELTGLSKTGEEIPIELSLSTILIEGHWHAVAVIRDITERRKAEEEIQKRVKELEEFYNMAVTRELKMIELKKEIEGLKEDLLKYKKE